MTNKLCKVCNEIKIAIDDGVYGDGKTRRLINEEGKFWNGRWCPKCNQVRIKLKMREIRAKRKS